MAINNGLRDNHISDIRIAYSDSFIRFTQQPCRHLLSMIIGGELDRDKIQARSSLMSRVWLFLLRQWYMVLSSPSFLLWQCYVWYCQDSSCWQPLSRHGVVMALHVCAFAKACYGIVKASRVFAMVIATMVLSRCVMFGRLWYGNARAAPHVLLCLAVFILEPVQLIKSIMLTK